MPHEFAHIEFFPQVEVGQQCDRSRADCARDRPLTDGAALASRPVAPGVRTGPQRAMVATVEGAPWHCAQHIPLRLDERDVRIADLKSRLKALPRQAHD